MRKEKIVAVALGIAISIGTGPASLVAAAAEPTPTPAPTSAVDLQTIEMIPYKEGVVIENTFGTSGFRVTIPKGFSIEKKESGIYAVSKSKSANITYTVGTSSENVTDIKTLAKGIASSYASDATVAIRSANKVKYTSAAGQFSGATIVLDVAQGTYKFTQKILIVPDGFRTHVVVYTEDENSGYGDSFDVSMRTAEIYGSASVPGTAPSTNPGENKKLLPTGESN